AAKVLAKHKGIQDRVTFLNIDAYYDKVEPHDVVFFSEVQAHSVVPFHSMFRVLGLAKEMLIADDFFGDGKIHLMGNPATGAVRWTGCGLAETTALTICYLAGITPEKVRRY